MIEQNQKWGADTFQKVIDFDQAKAKLEHRKDELIPAEVAIRLVLGDDHPLKVWRELRGLTKEQLSDVADVSQTHITEIEAGIQRGNILELRSLAGVLNIKLSDLFFWVGSRC